MRKSIFMAAAASLLVAAVSVPAEMKVGYINSDAILAKYEGAKEIKDKLDKQVAKWEQEASKRQNEMKAMKDQIDKQSLLLSTERKKELEDSLQAKYVAYQQFLQEKFGQKGEAYAKQEELSKPMVDKIMAIIQKIAKDENFDFIFDAKGGAIVYALPKYDLTERVIVLLNKEK